MNRPAVRILLTIVVLGIWGIVGYRIWRNYNPEEEADTSAKVTDLAPPLPVSPAEPYELRGDYPDPFGRTLSRKRSYRPAPSSNRPSPRNTRPKPVQKQPEVAPQWPQLKYNGVVANNDRKTKGTAYLQVGNRFLRVEPGKTYQGVKVLSYNRDKMTVEFNGEERTLEKN